MYAAASIARGTRPPPRPRECACQGAVAADRLERVRRVRAIVFGYRTISVPTVIRDRASPQRGARRESRSRVEGSIGVAGRRSRRVARRIVPMGVFTRPALGRVTKVLERLVSAVGETTGVSSTRHARGRPRGDFARVSSSADACDASATRTRAGAPSTAAIRSPARSRARAPATRSRRPSRHRARVRRARGLAAEARGLGRGPPDRRPRDRRRRRRDGVGVGVFGERPRRRRSRRALCAVAP